MSRAIALLLIVVVAGAEVEKRIDINDIINIGKVAWSVIKDGKPVVDYYEDYATAIPRNAPWDELDSFQDYRAGPYGWKFADYIGTRTVEFSWYFTSQCAGSYAGHGKFLTNVGATITSIYSAWGFTVNVNCSTPAKPINYGTLQDPIAGLQVFVSMEVQTSLQTFVKKCLATVRGDCQLKLIVCDEY